ncbi:S9 family peptidase [Robiginitomaculum antarcticum]|uniref:S9 family peptidase n=1 Tax=Robiginitomaculum antarcticum TaxID=437507 RepID=UPI0003821CD7|nr:S9 family peptidase [Robiginitomaculum antarcticum]
MTHDTFSLFELTATAPRARKQPLSICLHGKTRIDDYAWMRADNWQEVMADAAALPAPIRDHLEAENAYMETVTAPLSDLKTAVFEEMKGRIKDDDSSVPAPHDDYLYGARFRPGDQYGLYFRRAKDSVDDTVLLDADALAQGCTYFDLGDVNHSPKHDWLAYSLDKTGSEDYAVYLRKIDGAEPAALGITKSTGNLIWAEDNETLYWVERDDNHRPCKVYRRNVHTDAAPELVYEETDPGLFVGIGNSDARQFIEISAHDHTSGETLLINARDPHAAPRMVEPRSAGHEYSVHDHPDAFYIITNEGGAVDFKIMRAPAGHPERAAWEEFIPHRPGTLILGIEVFQNFMVRLERKDALPQIIVHHINTGEEHVITFDDAAYSLGFMGGYEFDTPWLRFTYSSPVQPGQVIDYNMETRERIVRKITQVPSGHNPDDYTCERIHIQARDGESIPVTLLYRSGLKLDGSAPCLLYGYGSYGITIPASFRTSILSLVDRGFIYAIAHIRGSKAKGYDWYLKGKLETKQATFDDYVDCGRALVARGYTSKGHIVAHGGSAGGLLVGAALNQAPGLFGAVIGAVPFVDVLTTMSDKTLPLTPPEWPEWGNPVSDSQAYDRIASYSPYDNIVDAAYPPVLITGGLSDPRVTYWEPAKWAAKLREHQTGKAPIVLKINMDAGHQGESGRYTRLKEVALEYAFAIAAIGAPETPKA